MGETKKALYSDKTQQQTACPLKAIATTSLEPEQISVAAQPFHINNIAQDLMLQLLHGLIFGIKEHSPILNKAREESKGEASKRTLQFVSFPQRATGVFLLC